MPELQDLVTLTIDGVEVTTAKGTTILEAAKQAGVVIPHYCYHPGLPVAGVCRMCLVHVEGVPKLQIACATPVAEGQVVEPYAPEAQKARQGVLEFLLINHPLDCPICDQAGECELQNYVFEEGRSRTRYTPDFAKRFNPVEDFGTDVLYVPNRCILCTRCVRFMDHVAEDTVLNVSERGDRASIGVHPDRQLDHAWSGNVVDLCPVGSLISKDFLHKARAWELDKTPSVCTSCSQGCNITIETIHNTVVRKRPRSNLDVNRYFMCDHGRLDYRWLNRGDRIEAPLLEREGELVACDWDVALQRVAEIFEGASGTVAVIASAGASNEALFLARQVAGDRFRGAVRIPRVAGEQPLPGVPNLALREERAPNGLGAAALGYDETCDEILTALDEIAALIVIDDPLEGVTAQQLAKVANLIYTGTVLPEAARGARVVFPTTNVVEEDGTFVNRDARVQRYLQAKSGPGMARPAWWVFSELLVELDRGESAASAAEAFERLAAEVAAFGGLSYERLGARGAMLEAPRGVGATA